MAQFDFEIVTDSSANLPDELIDKYGIPIIPLVYIVDGKESLSYYKTSVNDMKKYYTLMREKIPCSTSCASRGNCEGIFEQILSGGKDVLYIGFDSALSATYGVVEGVLRDVAAKYPDRKALAIDTLSAALGQGQLVISAVKLRDGGKTIDEIYAWLQANILKSCHLFTVDTLTYLYKGGRVKPSAYLLASVLNIKPIMHVSDDGHLTPIGKVFGRKASLVKLAALTAEKIVDPENQTIYISHGDCFDDVEFFMTKLKEKIKVKGFVINCLDLVIGVHAGPGTVAIFFYGEKR
jgi:DegV family protein with EDD domain